MEHEPNNLGAGFDQINKNLAFELGHNEKRFLIDTFGKSIGHFGLFGVLASVISTVVKQTKIIDNAGPGLFMFMIVAVASTFWCMSRMVKWERNLMNNIDTDKQYISFTYGLLYFFESIFFGLSIPLACDQLGMSDMWSPVALTAGIFVLAILGFSIPAVIGVFFMNRQRAITIKKLLSWSCGAYIVIFFIMLLTQKVLTQTVISGLSDLCLFLFAVMAFLAPVIQCYKMAEVAKVINYDDLNEVQKWKSLFVFQTLLRMMEIAHFILRLILRNRRN